MTLFTYLSLFCLGFSFLAYIAPQILPTHKLQHTFLYSHNNEHSANHSAEDLGTAVCTIFSLGVISSLLAIHQQLIALGLIEEIRAQKAFAFSAWVLKKSTQITLLK